MKQQRAYTPGLAVVRETTVRKVRELPLPGKHLVARGDLVRAEDDVLRAELPGDIEIVRLADRLGFEPEDVVEGMLVSEGDPVERGQLLCELSSFFGLFKTQFTSPINGTVEFFTESNAHLGLRPPPEPLSITAYIDGLVTEVHEGRSVTIEAHAALLQGVFGVGGERRGTLHALSVAAEAVVDVSDLHGIAIEGAILVGGASFTPQALHHAAESGVVGVVTGSISSESLSHYVGYEIGVSITGDENVPATLIVTEGFGLIPIAERVRRLAAELHGKLASINGATQVRAGAMRPEVIVTHEQEVASRTPLEAPKFLETGAAVRIIRPPFFGKRATVEELPSEAEKVESGAEVRVARVRLENGELVSVPRANLELT